MDKRTRRKTARKLQATRPHLARGNQRIPSNGQFDTLAAKPQSADKRPAWLREHGLDCKCIGCFNFKPEVMAIYTGNSRHPYRCPYCGEYLTSWGTTKRHMGKIIVPHPERTCCPQLQIGILNAGKIQYRDSGDMRLLQ